MKIILLIIILAIMSVPLIIIVNHLIIQPLLCHYWSRDETLTVPDHKRHIYPKGIVRERLYRLNKITGKVSWKWSGGYMASKPWNNPWRST